MGCLTAKGLGKVCGPAARWFAPFGALCVVCALGAAGKTDTPTGRKGPDGAAAIVTPLKGEGQSVAQAVESALREAGFQVARLAFDDVCAEGALSPSKIDLLVLPDANVFPANAIAPLEGYLRAGGRMIVIGAKPFQQWAVKSGGEWIVGAGGVVPRPGVKPAHMIQDFDRADIGPWTVNAKERNKGNSISRETPGADDTAGCAKVFMPDMQGWMTVVLAPQEAAFPKGETLTCFWAKGDKNTPRLSVGWREKDGARWIGVLDITTEWRLYSMAPADFKFWGNGSPKTRGKAGDAFNPANAASFSIGLSNSHTGEAPGPHTFWFDQLGVAPGAPAAAKVTKVTKATKGAKGVSANATEIDLPGLSPWYCLYPIEAPASLASVSPIASVDKVGPLPSPKNVFCPVPRCKGQGYRNQAPYRWMPLVEARDASGHRLGCPVTMLVNTTTGSLPASAWAAFTFDDPAAWENGALRALLGRVARRLTDGVVLTEGGTDLMAYYPGEKIVLGAGAVNLGKVKAPASVRFRSPSLAAIDKSEEWNDIPGPHVTVEPDSQSTVEIKSLPVNAVPGVYAVTCELEENGMVVDRIAHTFSVLEPRGQFDPKSAVRVENGQFTLGGKPWRPVGVNYNPLYYAATEVKEWKYNWLTPGFYQPDVVEEDLRMVADLGLNTLSIQTLDEPNVKAMRNLLDLFRRAQLHGLKVNTHLRSAEPMNLRPDALRALAEGMDLANNEAIFAYDISWEPKFGGKKDKKDVSKYDAEWTKWVIERYGSIENAEKDWGFKAKRVADNEIGAPENNRLLEDGAWTSMAIAYRRFINDYVSARFRDSTTLLRSLDPNHLISFRTGSAASGGNPSKGDLPYDFAAVAKACDFLCPECWSLKKTPGAKTFAVAYCRMVAPRKPVVWAEFGYSAWIKGQKQIDPKGLPTMRDFVADYYQGMLDAGAQGGMIWRWTGGYRVDEQSDFGVCGQDRKPRPVWEAIRKYAPLLKAAPPLPQPDAWIDIDTGAHAGGYAHVFQAMQTPFAEMVKEGKVPGLRTEAIGKTSVDVPLVAVGNKPYTGANPPKYLNAEFNWIRIEDASGKMVEAKDGAAIEVAAGKPVKAEASIGNIGPVEWFSPLIHKGVGGVWLSSRAEGGLKFDQPIQKNTPSLGDAKTGKFILTQGVTQSTQVVFEMTAKDRAWFGEKMRVTLKPADK